MSSVWIHITYIIFCSRLLLQVSSSNRRVILHFYVFYVWRPLKYIHWHTYYTKTYFTLDVYRKPQCTLCNFVDANKRSRLSRDILSGRFDGSWLDLYSVSGFDTATSTSSSNLAVKTVVHQSNGPAVKTAYHAHVASMGRCVVGPPFVIITRLYLQMTNLGSSCALDLEAGSTYGRHEIERELILLFVFGGVHQLID
jgi:hypothetical protein